MADEARRIAKAISRIPECMRKDYSVFKVSDHPRWSKSCPYHVALAETYVQENYDKIVACCRYNGVPCDRTGGVEQIEGRHWCVYKFAPQIDAIRFWVSSLGAGCIGLDFCILSGRLIFSLCDH